MDSIDMYLDTSYGYTHMRCRKKRSILYFSQIIENKLLFVFLYYLI